MSIFAYKIKYDYSEIKCYNESSNMGGNEMDFTLLRKTEADGICYKLLRTNFYRGYYVIIAQSKNDFYCGSFKASKAEALKLFDEISESVTEPFSLADILSDYTRQKV